MRLRGTHPNCSVIVLRASESQHLLGGVNLVEHVFEYDRLAAIATPNPADDGLQEACDSEGLNALFVIELDSRIARVQPTSDELRQFLPRPTDTPHKDRFQSVALAGRGRLVDQEYLGPVAINHVLRRIEGNHDSEIGERNVAESPGVNANRPVAHASFVRA